MRSAVAFLLAGLITGPAAVRADEEIWARLKRVGVEYGHDNPRPRQR
jgi:hypothetical protein